jgi:hypothetical protein
LGADLSSESPFRKLIENLIVRSLIIGGCFVLSVPGDQESKADFGNRHSITRRFLRLKADSCPRCCQYFLGSTNIFFIETTRTFSSSLVGRDTNMVDKSA